MKLEESRAEYFKERRKTRKHFGALLYRTLVENMEKKLEENNVSKANWLREKINEYLSEKK